MRPGIRHLAGSPTGQYGFTDGYGSDATFNHPLDIAIAPNGTTIYIADFGNSAIRLLDLVNGYVSLVCRLNCRPRHLAVSPDGTRLLVTGDYSVAAGSLIVEIIGIPTDSGQWFDGSIEEFPIPNGMVGAIAYSPQDDGTAIVRARTDLDATGWHSLALTGAERGTLTEPPTVPDPPYCDPPTNEVPMTVVRVRDGDWAGDAGVAYAGAVVVAYQYVWETSGWGALTAFDPWSSATPTFPAPYVTCEPSSEPAAVTMGFVYETYPYGGFWPRQLAPGPTRAGVPTFLAPLWLSQRGIVQSVQVDITNAAYPFTVDFDPSMGITKVPAMGVAYSPVVDRTFFSTAHTSPDRSGQLFGHALNQIVELTMVSDPPVFSGGSGVMSIGRYVEPEVPVGVVDENGNVLVDENGNRLLFG